MYGNETALRISITIPPLTEAPPIIRAEMNWLDRLPSTGTTIPPRIILPRMAIGGYPSVSTYSISAPIASRASTSWPIGRSCIRCSPRSTYRPGTNGRKPVRKRMAVPALPTNSSIASEYMLIRGPIVTELRRLPSTSKPSLRTHSSMKRESSLSSGSTTVVSPAAIIASSSARLVSDFDGGAATDPFTLPVLPIALTTAAPRGAR